MLGLPSRTPEVRSGSGIDKLRQFDQHVLAGGYYFVPPLDDATQPWTWHIPAAT